MGKPFEDKHAKIDIIQGDTMYDEFLGWCIYEFTNDDS